MRMTHRHGKRDTAGGQAMLMATLFFLGASIVVLAGIARPLLTDLDNVRQIVDSKQSYFFAEGGVEDVSFRITNGLSYSTTEVLAESGFLSETVVTTSLGEKRVEARGDVDGAIRRAETVLVEGAGASFNYGMQSDVGGVHLQDTASVSGNIFSNGPVTGANSNSVTGDVVSADSSGSIDGVNLDGSAHAHTIESSVVGTDAYYQVISGTTVAGTEYPGSPDQDPAPLPITDEMIEEWKSDAQAGGVHSDPCPYQISGSATLGPLKVECDLQLQGGGGTTITLAGAVWVEGDITIQDQVTVQIDNTLSGKTVPVVAHDPSNETSKGRITLQNKASFEGAGANSYVIFVSQNTSAEQGGGTAAITVQDQTQGDLLVYAGHGKIVLQNGISLREVTGYRIEAQNSAEIIYESGLANILFTTGPSGGFTLSDWNEVE